MAFSTDLASASRSTEERIVMTSLNVLKKSSPTPYKSGLGLKFIKNSVLKYCVLLDSRLRKFGEADHNLPKAIITDNSFRRWERKSYEFRVMNLASPNVMRVLRTRYDMIALLLQTAPKVHHNYAKRIITHNSFRKWGTRSYEFRVMNLASPNVMRVLRTRYDMIALLL